ncbi:MAG TPA: hypothetical protein EYQ31_08785 [Candidatus Handelsmanbacteria bacterium]|nr:hypothetical protein [Candidatus Handelsmanbacteria bacterium]
MIAWNLYFEDLAQKDIASFLEIPLKWEINTCIGNHEQQDMFHHVLSGYLPGEYHAGLGVGSLYGTSMMSFRFNNADSD